jgi:pimeloyl-ACP methyl ester carboxylesterase
VTSPAASSSGASVAARSAPSSPSSPSVRPRRRSSRRATPLLLIPYGRYCNATKFAGEVDVFEALAATRAHYAIDQDRIAIAGFSMGGASTWHLAAHHAGRWAAAAPGAGFAETPVYAKVFAPGKEPPTAWEQQLFHWYNATDYAANFFNLPVIAYSGEIDPQKQAADMMAQAMAAEGLTLPHLIGPQTAHKYHPETKAELTARLETLLDRGRDRATARDSALHLHAALPRALVAAVRRPRPPLGTRRSPRPPRGQPTASW